MTEYRVEVFYKTKREGVCCGITVEAFTPEEAEDSARDKILRGYPARKFMGCKVSDRSGVMLSFPLKEITP